MDQVNPESEVVNIVSAIADNERAKAIDAIQDLLYAKASDSLSSYKQTCLLYTSPSPRDATLSRMPSSA